MPQATISPRYQVLIPKEIRKEVLLVAGQVVQVIARSGVIILIPDRPLSSLRGIARGMNIEGFREKKGTS